MVDIFCSYFRICIGWCCCKLRAKKQQATSVPLFKGLYAVKTAFFVKLESKLSSTTAPAAKPDFPWLRKHTVRPTFRVDESGCVHTVGKRKAAEGPANKKKQT